MSNIVSDLNNLVNNLSTSFNTISTDFTNLQSNSSGLNLVKKSGDTMNGDLNMNSHKLTNLSNGVANTDAVNLSQLPTKLSDLTVANTTDISLNSHKLTNVSNATNPTDAVNLSQLPKKLSDLTVANTTDISLNSHKLTNVSNGVANTDAVNLGQVNSLISSNSSSSNVTKLSDLTGANTSNISLNSYKLTNVADGTLNNDAVNLNQVNTLITNAKQFRKATSTVVGAYGWTTINIYAYAIEIFVQFRENSNTGYGSNGYLIGKINIFHNNNYDSNLRYYVMVQQHNNVNFTSFTLTEGQNYNIFSNFITMKITNGAPSFYGSGNSNYVWDLFAVGY